MLISVSLIKWQYLVYKKMGGRVWGGGRGGERKREGERDREWVRMGKEAVR
jgi:hypothetical protein